MTPEEKIEALREWLRSNDEPDSAQLSAGYLKALTEVRDIIDPPILCDCGQEDVRGATVERAGVKHSETWCKRCCPHGAFVSEVCEECNPPKPKWRQMADAIEPAEPPLHIVLWHLAEIANDRNLKNHLAGIIAVAEAQVGDGWQADPDRVPVGHWGIPWLLVTLSQEPPAWHVFGNRAAAWLRDLCNEPALTIFGDQIRPQCSTYEVDADATIMYTEEDSLDYKLLDGLNDLVQEAPSGDDIIDQCLEVARVLLNKNISYGNSALEPAGVFSRATAKEQIATRIDDKLNRLKKGSEYADEDTILDLIGYLILYRIANEKEMDTTRHTDQQ